YNNVAIRYTFPFIHFNVMDQPDDLTLYSAPIDVTAALCRDQSGAMTAIGTARRSL
ncbi:hypothetical protein L249_7965, partial [Ophiocordyceps polyrhachis-furcata BCC 54312]